MKIDPVEYERLKKLIKPDEEEEDKTETVPMAVFKESLIKRLSTAVSRYIMGWFLMACALALMVLEIEMGVSVSLARAKDDTNQALWWRLNIVVALLTCTLVSVSTELWRRHKYATSVLAITLWLCVCLPLSLYNVQAFVSQNLADVIEIKTQKTTPEIEQLQARYDTVLKQSQDECSTGKTKNKRGENCHKLESEAKELFSSIEAKRGDIKQDTKVDPANVSLVRMLHLANLNLSVETVRVLVSILIMLIVSIGSGIVFMLSIKIILSE
jgi:hypothetical protein